jgi:hypothetical protein
LAPPIIPTRPPTTKVGSRFAWLSMAATIECAATSVHKQAGVIGQPHAMRPPRHKVSQEEDERGLGELRWLKRWSRRSRLQTHARHGRQRNLRCDGRAPPSRSMRSGRGVQI